MFNTTSHEAVSLIVKLNIQFISLEFNKLGTEKVNLISNGNAASLISK
jgi:hypothetical protein